MIRKELVEHLALLKEQARNSGANTFIWDISQESFNFVIDSAIKALEQEPRKGHWIEHPHEAGPCWEYSRYECSECHDWAEDDSDYCPYCGAKMESEDT